MGHASSSLDRFIANPEIKERLETTVRAPRQVDMDVATLFDMHSLRAVKTIFWLRERLMRAPPSGRLRPQGILEETKSLGWGVLAEQPGRFMVCGAACRPWLADVTFSAIAPDEFLKYAEPDQVKIAWTLEAE